MPINRSGDANSIISGAWRTNQSAYFSNRSIQSTFSEINNADEKDQGSYKRSIINFIHGKQIDAVAGIALAYTAVKTLLGFKLTTFALDKIRHAKKFPIADLRSLLSDRSDTGENLVVVRGIVQPIPDWINLLLGPVRVVKSDVSGNTVTGVFLYRDYHEWLDKWIRVSKKTFKAVPFVIAANDSPKDCVGVNFDVPLHSLWQSHPLPLTTLFQVDFYAATTNSFIGLKEEKILPIGKEISAIGHIFHGISGTPQVTIKPCSDIPYFLSDLTQDQMIGELAYKRIILFCGGITLGLLSVCVLGHTFSRYWRAWKKRN